MTKEEKLKKAKLLILDKMKNNRVLIKTIKQLKKDEKQLEEENEIYKTVLYIINKEIEKSKEQNKI